MKSPLITALLCSALTISLFVQHAVAESATSQRISVVLSTDVGNEIDDQWAIAYLFTNPTFDVMGVISAHAPSLPDPSAHVTYLVLRDEVENQLGLKVHPPLFEGSSLPLQNTQTARPNEGTNFLIAASRGFSPEHRLVVLTIGAATDVASAILQDPTVVDRIRIVAMAFSNNSTEGGKEYNVENDVKAWQVLLQSRVPITIGSGDICREYLALNFDQAERLIRTHGAVGAWLWDEYRSWYYRNVKPLRVNDFSRSWFIWDIITLADLQGFATEKVMTRPELEDNLALTFPAPGNNNAKNITWITAVDSARLWTDFCENLDDFQRRHAVGSKVGSGTASVP